MTDGRFLPNPVRRENLAELARLFPPSADIRPAFPIVASASPHLPYWVQVLLDAATWKALLGIPAAAFLKKLAENAADDLWKNKGRLAELLRESAFRTLSDISFGIAAANEQIGSMGIHVGLPTPDTHWGAHTSLAYRSGEEVSVPLARFVVAAEKIESLIKVQGGRHPVLGPVDVSVDPGEPIEVSWLTPAARDVRFVLETVEGKFVEK